MQKLLIDHGAEITDDILKLVVRMDEKSLADSLKDEKISIMKQASGNGPQPATDPNSGRKPTTTGLTTGQKLAGGGVLLAAVAGMYYWWKISSEEKRKRASSTTGSGKL